MGPSTGVGPSLAGSPRSSGSPLLSPAASSPSSPSSANSSTEQSNKVATRYRDDQRCVITGQSHQPNTTSGVELHCCHILNHAELRRQFNVGFIDFLQRQHPEVMERYGAFIRQLSPEDKKRLKQHRAGPSTPHGSDRILHLPHWDGTHPTLMLYADKRFNNRIEDGRVWFQPVPDRPDDYFVCCAEDEDNDFLLQHCTRVDANGALVDGAILHQLRRPDAWNPARLLLPPPLVFDLHREVWVRYRRWVGQSKGPQARKEDGDGDAEQPVKGSNKKQKTGNSV